MLQYAALIGRRFDTATLLALLGQGKSQFAGLQPAAGDDGRFDLPLDESYRFLVAALEQPERASTVSVKTVQRRASPQPGRSPRGAGSCLSFSTIVSSRQPLPCWMNSSSRVFLCRSAGCCWRKPSGVARRLCWRSIFDIVDHLNSGSGLIIDPMESIKLAQLNLMASEQARDMAAFEAASSYLSAGMQLLPADSWQNSVRPDA